MAQIKICKEPDCQDAATTKGYCRLHYLRHWKEIKEKERHRAAKKLNSYIESICKKHPDRYMEAIKDDLRSSRLDRNAEETFGFENEAELIFDEPTYEEEIQKLIDELKIEKGF